jgi:DNA-binding transcriptional regulator WhiA
VSFSAQVKNELGRILDQSICCVKAEIYGILLFANTFSDTQIRIVTKIRHLFQASFLFTKAFDMD